MSIKRKQKGPMPTFTERWQEIAKDVSRTNEAVQEYMYTMRGYDSVTVASAYREVRNFQRKWRIIK